MRTLILLFTASCLSASAQTTSNFTIDDIDGNTRDLFTELDNGNIVVLKFFTSWCTICNNTADEVVDIYNAYRTNGDPVVFWALDRDPNETNVHATAYRDDHNIPFPVIGEAYPVAQQFGVVYQPEYYIIRPDRSYVKKTNYTSMQSAVDDALASISTGIEESSGTETVELAGSTLYWSGPTSQRAQLIITDMAGRTVMQRTISGQSRTHLNQLNNGIYLYLLTQNGTPLAKGKMQVVR